MSQPEPDTLANLIALYWLGEIDPLALARQAYEYGVIAGKVQGVQMARETLTEKVAA